MSSKPSNVVIQKDDLAKLFVVRVMTVDSLTPSLSVRREGSAEMFGNVTRFPIGTSSYGSTDLTLPEEGTCGMAEYIGFSPGTRNIAIVCWIPSGTLAGLGAMAFRAVTDPNMVGFSTRRRGVHRKPYPGQRSSTSSHGLHTFEDTGYNMLARDLSEVLLDPDRREHTLSTGRTVDYTEAGLSFSGPVNRPGADPTIVPVETLPDGTTRQVVLLTPGVKSSSRYLQGSMDLLPVVEHLERVQEFGLDHPVPREILETSFLDGLLGSGAGPWGRTNVVTQGTAPAVQRDDQDFLVDQGIDHPTDIQEVGTSKALATTQALLGPTTKEGQSPRRRGWIVERVTGTVVGYHRPDTTTYGQVLKPVLFPLNTMGRFETGPETGFQPVLPSLDHAEARLAAAASLTRFPYDYNTTRKVVTKEGLVQFELGATLPRENIGLDLVSGLSKYEHPHGAGRSLEAHLVGSAQLVVGKNRDEEDAVDFRALGQVVLRLGADDGSAPDAGRAVHVQNRAQGDAVTQRTLQYWDQAHAKLVPGDAVSLDAGQKTGAENISLRAALDGGAVLRIGARNPASKRRHLTNGYIDGPGRHANLPGQGNRAATPGRVTYTPDGDLTYQFNDLKTAGQAQAQPVELLYMPSADCLGSNLDYSGLSADIHACQDILLRVGRNNLSGYSILLDLDGGIIGIVGKDNKGTSLKSTFKGGIEMSIGKNDAGQAMALEVLGDVNWVIRGNWQVHCTGDIVFDSMSSIYSLAKKDHVVKGTNVYQTALTKLVHEAPDMPKNQGFSSSPALNSNFHE